MTRGPSKAAQDAEKHLAKNPETKAADLARKFGIDVSTVMRAPWWKTRAKVAK